MADCVQPVCQLEGYSRDMARAAAASASQVRRRHNLASEIERSLMTARCQNARIGSWCCSCRLDSVQQLSTPSDVSDKTAIAEAACGEQSRAEDCRIAFGSASN